MSHIIHVLRQVRGMIRHINEPYYIRAAASSWADPSVHLRACSVNLMSHMNRSCHMGVWQQVRGPYYVCACAEYT